ncbi:MAG: hypothetical protein QXW55_04295 [Candidatus Bathyarchaeia archaeon]
MSNRCIVCGEPIEQEQLCSWCKDPRFESILQSLVENVDEQLQQTTRIDVKMNPTFSLIADLGLLGIRHPYLALPSKILARLINESGKGKRVLEVNNLRYGQKNPFPFLLLLDAFGLIKYNMQMNEIHIPDDSILLKIRHEIEVDPKRSPAAAFALGYLTLKAMLQTINIAKTKTVEYGEGITALYSATRDRNGRIKIVMPKSYVAALSFIFGYWARGFTEFSELDLHKFMVVRGITGKEFSEVLANLSCAFATAHALYERISTEYLGRVPIYRFKLNEEYVRLYERLRERTRVRV